MKEPSLTQAELRQDTVARDIKRLWNLQGKTSNPKNIEMLLSIERSIAERLVKLVSDPETALHNLAMLRRELQRPLRTDLERKFVNAYFEEYYRTGERPTYKAIKQKFEASGLQVNEKNLQRMNKRKLHLGMPRRGRPRKRPLKK